MHPYGILIRNAPKLAAPWKALHGERASVGHCGRSLPLLSAARSASAHSLEVGLPLDVQYKLRSEVRSAKVSTPESSSELRQLLSLSASLPLSVPARKQGSPLRIESVSNPCVGKPIWGCYRGGSPSKPPSLAPAPAQCPNALGCLHQAPGRRRQVQESAPSAPGSPMRSMRAVSKASSMACSA